MQPPIGFELLVLFKQCLISSVIESGRAGNFVKLQGERLPRIL